MNTRPICATITRCCAAQPLVVIDSAPFNGLEIRPNDLRCMARQLDALADMAAHWPTNCKRYLPTRVQIDQVAP